ncbi:MAG: hypothetical protein NWF13_04420 [Candidatus Bathyarchaeota archaeon]|nr:hypothetical protein [Candidatus Bathyarchaeota archaeon]
MDEDDVPPPLRKRLDWEKVFRAIPVGKARLIRSEDAYYTTVRQALKRFQEKGIFTNYGIRTRKIGDARKCYIINSRKS